MSYISWLMRVSWLKEKGMVITVSQTTIDMEKAGDRHVVTLDEFGVGQSQCSGIPIVLRLVGSFGVGDPVVAPAMGGSRTWFESLEAALARLLVFIVHG
jgi:hypothetical protein